MAKNGRGHGLGRALTSALTPDEHLAILLYLLQLIGGSPGLPPVAEVDFRRGFLPGYRPFGRPLPYKAASLREGGDNTRKLMSRGGYPARSPNLHLAFR